jgi:hypothetical protein
MADLSSGPYEQGLGSLHAAIQDAGCLRNREPVEIAQRECRTVLRSELGEHLVSEQTIQFDIPRVEGISGQPLDGLEKPFLTSLPAPVIHQLVASDSNEPADGHWLVQTIPRHGQERLRGQVFGNRPVAAASHEIAVHLG